MRIERCVYSILILIAATAALINWRRAIILSEDNEQLRLKIESLETDANTSSNVVDMVRTQSEKMRAQTLELVKLRNEVTQLRDESKQAKNAGDENQRLKEELARLKSSVANAQPPATNSTRAGHFPRESWSFSGYASPEAALVSAIWSMKEGNPRSYLESLAPSEQERMAEVWQNKSEDELAAKHRNDVAAISGIRVLERQDIAAGEIVMNVFLEGVERTEKIRMNQVGQDWKFGGFIREAAAP
jgi:hypothetical protein